MPLLGRWETAARPCARLPQCGRHSVTPHTDPRVNLALTLERAGRIDEALAGYESALEVWPDYLPAIQGLASLTVRTGKQDARLARWLDAIAMRAESSAWREWARARRLGFDQ